MDNWPDPGRALRILVVEDDPDIASVLTRILRGAGLEARIAEDGELALTEVATFKPDLVLLDLGLPKLDGVKVAQTLRSGGFEAGIIALTARDEPEDKVEGLDSGLDDYVVKPFNREELLARMRSVFRRRPPKGAAALVAGSLILDPDTMLGTIDGRPLELTSREFEMLVFLLQNRGIVISRQQLLEEVWGYSPFAETNTIEVFVSNLRRKLEENGEERVLQTVRGAGYVIRN
ncbi:MAG: response regulator transcription factor [Solirubrobacterales bacterium]|nr:response regulator transcription factor [Solirubrobacterales bacterium]